MTEFNEVEALRRDLLNIKTELTYEAVGWPGEGPEVAEIFFKAAHKIGEVIDMLDEAYKIMYEQRFE